MGCKFEIWAGNGSHHGPRRLCRSDKRLIIIISRAPSRPFHLALFVSNSTNQGATGARHDDKYDGQYDDWPADGERAKPISADRNKWPVLRKYSRAWLLLIFRCCGSLFRGSTLLRLSPKLTFLSHLSSTTGRPRLGSARLCPAHITSQVRLTLPSFLFNFLLFFASLSWTHTHTHGIESKQLLNKCSFFFHFNLSA